MTESLQTIGYLSAAILFILSLGGLSNQETAKVGNLCGIAGMVIALVVTFGAKGDMAYGISLAAIGIGAVIGVTAALKVAMTALPELVAMLHSFVGLAAVTDSELVIDDIVPGHLRMIRLALEKIGVTTEIEGSSLFVPGNQELVIQDDLHQ
ncbi:MAG: NAD(P)(+) transhydrogenase (Re/Si-specific) subunit beta, partial [Bradymonadaceae bacterium]